MTIPTLIFRICMSMTIISAIAVFKRPVTIAVLALVLHFLFGVAPLAALLIPICFFASIGPVIVVGAGIVASREK